MQNKELEQGAIDAMTERGVSFTVTGDDGASRSFCIKPPTLGKMAVISSAFLDMDIDMDAIEKSPMKESARIFAQKVDDACRLMAVAVSNTREEIEDAQRMNDTAQWFKWNADAKVFCSIVKVLVIQSDYVNFISATRLMETSRIRHALERGGGLVAEEGRSEVARSGDGS